MSELAIHPFLDPVAIRAKKLKLLSRHIRMIADQSSHNFPTSAAPFGLAGLRAAGLDVIELKGAPIREAAMSAFASKESEVGETHPMTPIFLPSQVLGRMVLPEIPRASSMSLGNVYRMSLRPLRPGNLGAEYTLGCGLHGDILPQVQPC